MAGAASVITQVQQGGPGLGGLNTALSGMLKESHTQQSCALSD